MEQESQPYLKHKISRVCSREDLLSDSPNKSYYLKAIETQKGSFITLDPNQDGLESSFYKLVMNRTSPFEKVSHHLINFINCMGKSLMDFHNRFPQGPPLPDRRVNLPKRPANSTLPSLLEKYTLIFDLDETLIHYNIKSAPTDSPVHPFSNIKPFSQMNAKQVVKVERSH